MKIFGIIYLVSVFAVVSNVYGQITRTETILEITESNVRLDKPLLSGRLSATLMSLDSKSLPNIRVEMLDDDWRNVIDSTFTDKKGKFKFSDMPKGIYNLRFKWYRGATESYLEIKIEVTNKLSQMTKIKIPKHIKFKSQ